MKEDEKHLEKKKHENTEVSKSEGIAKSARNMKPKVEQPKSIEPIESIEISKEKPSPKPIP